VDADLGEWADTGLATLEAPEAAEARVPWSKPAEAGAPGGNGRRATLPGDSQHALVCPSCQRLMLRYRVAEPAMGLDFCFACTLVWLDHGEWELLAQHGLQLKITQISTSYWQRSQQRQRLQAQREANLRELLGDAAFEQAMAFQRWLAQQPEREAILRFLRSDPPLDA
jgi:Zn-finger nucleic acid-binding protein